MKFTLIGPVSPYRGGIAHYTALLAQKLESAGHQVEVISFRRMYPAWLYPGKTNQDTSTERIEVPARFILDPLSPWSWLKTAREIVSFKPDLVNIQWWTTFWTPTFVFLLLYLKRAGIKTSFLVQNVLPHEPRFFDRPFARLTLSLSDINFVQTHKEAERLKELHVQGEPVIIPHPIHRVFAENRVSREEARSRLNLPLDAPVVLSFGMVRPYKGMRYLLQAVEKLTPTHPNLHAMIVGEFWEPEEEYLSLIESLGIQGRAHLYNRYIPNEEVATFFGAADVFAAPYIDSSSSSTVKTAIGFGLPIVLTPCVVDEMLAGMPNTWLIEEKDAGSLADGIVRALTEGKILDNHNQEDGWAGIIRMIEEQVGQDH